MIVNGGGSVIGRNISFATSCSLGAGVCMPPDMAMAPPTSGGGCKCALGGRGAAGGPARSCFALVPAGAGYAGGTQTLALTAD